MQAATGERLCAKNIQNSATDLTLGKMKETEGEASCAERKKRNKNKKGESGDEESR